MKLPTKTEIKLLVQKSTNYKVKSIYLIEEDSTGVICFNAELFKQENTFAGVLREGKLIDFYELDN